AEIETQSHYHVPARAYFGFVRVDVLPFLAIAVLLIVMPGPDTAMVTKNALVGGRRAGMLAAVGGAGGPLIWTTAGPPAIAALLPAAEVAFDALKFAGALYLAWIGIQTLRSRGLPPEGPAAKAESGARALRQGLLCDLSNPKVAIFFTSLLPQFVHGTGP